MSRHVRQQVDRHEYEISELGETASKQTDRITQLTTRLFDRQDVIINQQATHTKKLHEHDDRLNTAQADILDLRQNEIDAIWRQVNDQEDEHRATRQQLTDDHNRY